jgi:hypothetical protein
MAQSNLAATIGTEYARMLHHILPKIEEAISRGKTSASFGVTAKFRVGQNGAVDVTLSQTASIPMENASFKLSYNSGQLSLFEGSPSSSEEPTT